MMCYIKLERFLIFLYLILQKKVFQNNDKSRKNVAALSVASNTMLVILKLLVGILTGSVSIISEAIHSGLDLVAAIIAFFSVRISSRPPDKTHPYGHGKFENVSGVIEAMLIIVAAVWIVFEAIASLRGEITVVANHGWGIGVMAVSGLVNFFVSRRLYRVAKKTDSIALEADALHLRTDVYTSLGVAMGLGIMYIVHLPVLDPIIAIAVALLILYEAYSLMMRAFSPLVDVSLDEKEVECIKSCLNEVLGSEYAYRELRTRKSGHYRYVDFILQVDPSLSVQEAHDFCDKLDIMIEQRLPNCEVTIHVEPLKN